MIKQGFIILGLLFLAFVMYVVAEHIYIESGGPAAMRSSAAKLIFIALLTDLWIIARDSTSVFLGIVAAFFFIRKRVGTNGF